jgi:hypothetical protein
MPTKRSGTSAEPTPTYARGMMNLRLIPVPGKPSVEKSK